MGTSATFADIDSERYDDVGVDLLQPLRRANRYKGITLSLPIEYRPKYRRDDSLLRSSSDQYAITAKERSSNRSRGAHCIGDPTSYDTSWRPIAAVRSPIDRKGSLHPSKSTPSKGPWKKFWRPPGRYSAIPAARRNFTRPTDRKAAPHAYNSLSPSYQNFHVGRVEIPPFNFKPIFEGYGRCGHGSLAQRPRGSALDFFVPQFSINRCVTAPGRGQEQTVSTTWKGMSALAADELFCWTTIYRSILPYQNTCCLIFANLSDTAASMLDRFRHLRHQHQSPADGNSWFLSTPDPHSLIQIFLRLSTELPQLNLGELVVPRPGQRYSVTAEVRSAFDKHYSHSTREIAFSSSADWLNWNPVCGVFSGIIPQSLTRSVSIKAKVTDILDGCVRVEHVIQARIDLSHQLRRSATSEAAGTVEHDSLYHGLSTQARKPKKQVSFASVSDSESNSSTPEELIPYFETLSALSSSQTRKKGAWSFSVMQEPSKDAPNTAPKGENFSNSGSETITGSENGKMMCVGSSHNLAAATSTVRNVGWRVEPSTLGTLSLASVPAFNGSQPVTAGVCESSTSPVMPKSAQGQALMHTSDHGSRGHISDCNSLALRKMDLPSSRTNDARNWSSSVHDDQLPLPILSLGSCAAEACVLQSQYANTVNGDEANWLAPHLGASPAQEEALLDGEPQHSSLESAQPRLVEAALPSRNNPMTIANWRQSLDQWRWRGWEREVAASASDSLLSRRLSASAESLTSNDSNFTADSVGSAATNRNVSYLLNGVKGAILDGARFYENVPLSLLERRISASAPKAPNQSCNSMDPKCDPGRKEGASVKPCEESVVQISPQRQRLQQGTGLAMFSSVGNMLHEGPIGGSESVSRAEDPGQGGQSRTFIVPEERKHKKAIPAITQIPSHLHCAGSTANSSSEAACDHPENPNEVELREMMATALKKTLEIKLFSSDDKRDQTEIRKGVLRHQVLDTMQTQRLMGHWSENLDSLDDWSNLDSVDTDSEGAGWSRVSGDNDGGSSEGGGVKIGWEVSGVDIDT